MVIRYHNLCTKWVCNDIPQEVKHNTKNSEKISAFVFCLLSFLLSSHSILLLVKSNIKIYEAVKGGSSMFLISFFLWDSFPPPSLRFFLARRERDPIPIFLFTSVLMDFKANRVSIFCFSFSKCTDPVFLHIHVVRESTTVPTVSQLPSKLEVWFDIFLKKFKDFSVFNYFFYF